MSRVELLRKMQRSRLVAVVRSRTTEDALALAQSAIDGGVKFVEITFSVLGALDVIKNLSGHSDAHVGAGTVLSKKQAESAMGAGAKFIVSPTLELDLIPLCHEANIPCFLGAATPTEILTAARADADLVKIFPADLVGGVDFIRQMVGPFPQVRFMVSGGVNLSNVKDYVQVGVVGICLGSVYLGGFLAQHGHERFVEEMTKFTKAVKEGQGLR
ncbi:MAG TPA: bifunctional 4-hydroxy-2-oxoglutarate aldolase/2-dehydro-3-deoxy-phosphogluconate aldolase [Candidatus Acidoferrales bacterium]|nr:bifunctional 4-hydroxy-2-oxoglutarate aldolase/2-dehydro-3-deoxy-phosphogluconate aldolase [Candidatus Acidoferrales bacterium]